MDYLHYFDSGYQWIGPTWVPNVFIGLIIWGFLWKGFALWRSAQRDEKWWFAIILTVNSLGILEIIYLLLIARDKTFRRIIGLERK